MAIRNFVLFGVICTLVTLGYGGKCPACANLKLTIDNVGCHRFVSAGKRYLLFTVSMSYGF